MITKILDTARVSYRQARFTAKPLPDTYAVYFDEREMGGADGINCLISYAVYFDEREMGGADGINCLITHYATIEVYESKPDNATETAIEAALDAYGVEWTSQARYWLEDVQRYQVIYEFTFIEKRRITHG